MKYIKQFLFIVVFICLLVVSVGCNSKTPSLDLLKDNIEMTEGETLEIKYTVTNLEGTNLVDFSIDSPEIISIENETITALKAGAANVTITLKDYPDISVNLHVLVNAKPGIRIEGKTDIYVNEETTLEAILTGIDGVVMWESDNDRVATVKDGVVKGRDKGTATITATCEDYKATIKINVARKPRIMLNGPKEVYVSKQLTLDGKLQFVEGELKWTSSDVTIATVEDGVVTGVNAGEVTITASFNDIKAEHKMTVLPKPTIQIIGKTELKEFERATLTATLIDYDGEFEWSSDNEKVIIIDEKGNMMAKGIGKATITVKAANGEEATKVITVTGYDKKIIYDFDGGVSEELYATNMATGKAVINNFNYNNGAFWGGAYTHDMFIGDKDHDPKATFSDRIYIGINQYTGFYEVIDFLQSGPSSWPEGATYVISLSNSHDSFWSLHDKIRDIQIGDVVFFDKPIESITKDNKGTFTFYNPKSDSNILLVTPDKYTGKLATPVKLGCEFIGWYDEDGNKVESIETIDKSYVLKAHWKQLNPVTEIKHNEIPAFMYTNDTLQINASVVPSNAFFQQIIFETTNPDIISVTEDGLLTAINTGTVTITIRDYASQVILTFEIVVKAVPSIDVKYDHYFDGVLDINETLQLEPTFTGEGDAKFTYESLNKDILTVDESGLVKGIKQGNGTILIKTTIDKEYTLTIGFTIDGLTETNKVDQAIKLFADNNFGVVETGNFCIYNDEHERYYQATYGSVNRFLFDELEINTKYVDTAVNNPNCHKSRKASATIEFVTVHDTATLTASPESIANNMSHGETSIHYTVGDDQIYQVVPEKYIAYHAGDGTGYDFEWRDSGVKANGNEKPDYDMVKDGNKYYLTINGTRTNIEVPTTGYRYGSFAAIENPTKDRFCDLGPVYTIKNGRYYVGPMWCCFTQRAGGAICSFGGNNNSIGIEMCVNTTGDMYDTLQRTAMLVADILIRNNLGFERVQMHNSWSGKDCPQTVRAGNYWDDFMMMVRMQYAVRKTFKDCEITMKSNNPEIVDNTGRVCKAPLTTTTVSYDVTVKCGTTEKTITLYSVIPGSTLWQKWNGTYPSSRVWNNGYYVR